MSSEEIKTKFIELLERDVSFRYSVLGYLGLLDILKRFEEYDRKFNEIIQEIRDIKKVQEEHDKK